MPITVRTASHPARQWQTQRVNSTEELLQQACAKEGSQCKWIIQSSFGGFIDEYHISSSQNGLVWAAYYAYSHHHHLFIRPEDVWFSILTQLSFYINAHAEELRSSFVAHEGQEELIVVDVGTIHTADFGRLAVQMTHEMEKKLVDPDLRAWIMPDFTTTSQTDKITASVLMMGTMQKYFSYTTGLTCGIPSVTLLGEKEDWMEIRRRIKKLSQYGEEPELFSRLLLPVLEGFIQSFVSPTDPIVTDFWSKIADKHMGSGPSYLSGWITAFCFWDVDGKSLNAKGGRNNDGCNINGTQFHRVQTDDVPAGYVSVPVTVNDNGKEVKTKMIAGSVAIAAASSGEKLDVSSNHKQTIYRTGPYGPPDLTQVAPNISDATGLDTLQPVTGWLMYECLDKAPSSGWGLQ